MTNNGGTEKDQKKGLPPWLYVLLTLLGAGALFAGFTFFTGDDVSTTETSDAGMDPELLLRLQTACFESVPPLFYDDQGFCYAVDPSSLSDDDRIAQRVSPTAAATDAGTLEETETEDTGAAEPAAPAAPAAVPAAPADAPAAPTTVAPTVTTASTTSTTAETTTTTTTSTTTAAAEPVNLPAGGWQWNIGFPDSLDGVACLEDEEGKYPPGCQDTITGTYSVNMGVTNGTVSGSQTIPGLGSKSAVFSGTVSPSGEAAMTVAIGNLGTFNLTGLLLDPCLISGNYSKDGAVGTFSMDSSRPGC